ncbi:MAG: histone deacetylase [Gammaproteobacteria bacterium]
MKRRQFLDYATKATILIGSGANSIKMMADDIKTGLVLDDDFRHHLIAPTHPESPGRYHAIKQVFTEQDIISQLTRIEPYRDIDHLLELNHTKEHIQSIKNTNLENHINASLATGGVIAAVDQVCTGKIKNAFCASRPPGHHARNTGREEGFCYYNHVAIAARYAQQEYNLKKILIVDWDYHHGDGTEQSFYADPDVLFFSTHDYFAYPGTGDPNKKGAGAGLGLNINVHMECGSDDADFIKAFEKKLLPAADQFEPDLILISCGFDSRENDLLGCFNITNEGYKQLTKMVEGLADKHCKGKIISVLEGGYNLRGIAEAAAIHVKELMS